MDKETVFTKTAKGITQVNQRSASLSKDLMKVLKLIDGKSSFNQIMEKGELDKPFLEKAMVTLQKDGFARIFETRKEEADPFGEDDDFDFTAPAKSAGATQRVVPSAANDISELSRQQEVRDSQKKNLEKAHEEARLKAKVQMEARAKAEAEARARAEAEQRAMEQARKAKEASERAKAELEAKMREETARMAALAEAQAKQAAAQKVKALEEAKRLAELRAKAESEANQRAKAELEAKLRVEQARQAEMATQQAEQAAAQKAREEEEGKKLSVLRARAEAEAKVLAEARTRAEAEAAALAKARADAEAAAKQMATEAAGAEKELKARLKEEIEARIRSEMEDLLRGEFEEKTRAELQASIMAEARMAAKAELEERLAEERASLQAAESAARTAAEQMQRERADNESKLRAEAEARAARESAARLKAEQETESLRRAAVEASARAQAETDALRRAAAVAAIEKEAAEKAKVAAARDLDAERRAKFEAEARAMVEAEEAERREKELSGRIDLEKKARADAEKRVQIEAKARETVEQDTRVKVQAELEHDLTKKAEIEGKAQAAAYMQAKAKAELDEEQRMRDEQGRKAREIADILRTKVEPDEQAPDAPVRRRRRRKNIVPTVLWSIAILLVVGIGALHVVPLRGVQSNIEKSLGAWLHDDVQIGSLKFSLLPTPHLKLESLAVGKLYDAKAGSGRIYVDLGALFSEKLSADRVQLDGVTHSADAVRRILTWGNPEGKANAAYIGSFRLRNVKLETRPAIDPFDATITYSREGKLASAFLTAGGGKWTAGFRPKEGGLDVDFGARNWELPLGAPIPVSDVKMKGTLTGTELTFPEFEADVMEGKVNGTLRVTWASGVKLESDLSVARIRADQLVKALTKDISITGKLDGNFSIVAEAATLHALMSAPRAQGKFKLTEGSISNVDLVAVMQSDQAGQRAGVTKFNELTGEVGSADHRSSFRQVALQGGVLRGSGNLEVGANSAISGRVVLEIRSQVAADRGAFTVTGTVAKPSIRRGG